MWKVKVVSKLHNWVKFHMGQIAQNDYFVEQHADDVTHSMEDAFWFLEKYQIFVHSCTQSEDKDIAKRALDFSRWHPKSSLFIQKKSVV